MMSFQRVFFCLVAGVLLGTSVAGQNAGSITAAALKTHVEKLADDKLEGRGGGYPGEKKAADHIAAEFKRIGLKPVGTKGFFQEFRFQPYHPVKAWELMTSRNVLGVIEGSDPALKNEVVVIGAHYDGQGRTGQADPTRNTPDGNKDDIWNSANDNAAGVAAVIEIARALKNSKPKRTILFAAFGAEEHGMTGSIYYVNHPVFPLVNHVAMINLEKLGRSPEKQLTVAGVMSSKAWPALVGAAAKAENASVTPSPIAFPDSDHYPFGSRGLPAVMVYVSSNTDAHFPSDTADKIDFERAAERARFAAGLLRQIADAPTRPDVVPSPMLDPGLIAHLATGAEIDAAGLPAGEGGLKVTGVIAGGPADVAGLREGDLIIQMGARKFAREEPLANLMAAYQDMLQGKMGVDIPLKLLRNKQSINAALKLRL